MKRLLLVLIIFFGSSNVFAAKVALVIENLPSTDSMTLLNANDINDQIIKILDKKNIPAVGFVNEERLYVDSNVQNRIDILRKWASGGYELGNQLYSNKSYHMIADNEYFREIEKGEKVIKNLANEYKFKVRYFLPPFSHFGTNAKSYNNLLQFLTNKGYILVPITILNDDWIFNRSYIKALEAQDSKGAKEILATYLAFTKKRFEFYISVSRQIFGREVDQVFLLHLNKLNADCFDSLTKIPLELGYEYASLETVLQDMPYSQKYRAFGKSGCSWLRRCDEMEGRVVDWRREPKVEDFFN